MRQFLKRDSRRESVEIRRTGSLFQRFGEFCRRDGGSFANSAIRDWHNNGSRDIGFGICDCGFNSHVQQIGELASLPILSNNTHLKAAFAVYFLLIIPIMKARFSSIAD